jgi:hypothetical protein
VADAKLGTLDFQNREFAAPNQTEKSFIFVNGNGDEEHAKQLTDRFVAGFKVVDMLLNLNAKDSGNENIVVSMEKS